MTNRTENFDGSASLLVACSDGGSDWVQIGLGVDYRKDGSGQGYCFTDDVDVFAYLETSVSDGDVGVTQSVDAAHGSGVIFWRLSDENNLWWLRTQKFEEMIRIYKRVAGSYSVVSNVYNGACNSGDAYHVTFNSSGDMEGFQNGVSRVTVTGDTFNSTATKVGIVSRGDSGNRFETFYFNGSGGSNVSGTGASTLGAITASGAGTLVIDDTGGTPNFTLGAVTVSGSGAVGGDVGGSGAVTLGAITAAGSGTVQAATVWSVRLTAANAGGADVKTRTNYITVTP